MCGNESKYIPGSGGPKLDQDTKKWKVKFEIVQLTTN